MKTLDIGRAKEQKLIATTLKTLNEGGLVIFPTETTYGAGVDATNQAAVDKLLTYKSRREGKPLSIAVSSQKMASEYVDINEQAQKLYQRFLPGPVTIISKSSNQVATGVESEFGTLGVRIPDHKLMLKILRGFGKPITATSANASGKKRPYKIKDIFDHLSNKQKSLVDLVLDAGELPRNDPSTVIDTTLSTPITLRSGKIEATREKYLTSRSEAETKKIAGTLMLKHWNQIRTQGLVIGLDGALGAGKTIFTKGIAEFLQIAETITSPTYSYIEEYDYQRHGANGKLFHIDLWKIENSSELDRLEIKKLIAPNQVVVIEWWNQGKEYLREATNLKIMIENLTSPLTRPTAADHHRKIIMIDSKGQQ